MKLNKGSFGIELDQTQSSHRLLGYADAYLSTANILVGHIDEMTVLYTVGPLYQNAGLACELLFKQLVFHFDDHISEVGELKTYGHDLDKLFDRLIELQVPVEDVVQKIRQTYRLRRLPSGLTVEDCARQDVGNWLTSFGSQVLALNENYLKFLEETKPSFRSRYPHDQRTYKPVNLDYLLPCLDALREFAFKEISQKTG